MSSLQCLSLKILIVIIKIDTKLNIDYNIKIDTKLNIDYNIKIDSVKLNNADKDGSVFHDQWSMIMDQIQAA